MATITSEDLIEASRISTNFSPGANVSTSMKTLFRRRFGPLGAREVTYRVALYGLLDRAKDLLLTFRKLLVDRIDALAEQFHILLCRSL
jgi:hypothetical protein